MKSTARHSLLVLGLAVVFAAVAYGQQDFSKVEIKTTKLGGNVYQLEGQGGHIGVLAGPDGVLMVDSQFAPLTDKIVAAIKAIGPSPIRFLINTHVHGDHTGGNAESRRHGRHHRCAPAVASPAREAESGRRWRARNAGSGGCAAPADL